MSDFQPFVVRRMRLTKRGRVGGREEDSELNASDTFGRAS